MGNPAAPVSIGLITSAAAAIVRWYITRIQSETRREEGYKQKGRLMKRAQKDELIIR
jgi:hypothetical protein